ITHPCLHSFPTRRSSDLRGLTDFLFVQATVSTSSMPVNAIVETRRDIRPRKLSETVWGRVFDPAMPSNARLPSCWQCKSPTQSRSEEHTSELQSRFDLVC